MFFSHFYIILKPYSCNQTVETDQLLHFAVFDQSLNCLPVSQMLKHVCVNKHCLVKAAYSVTMNIFRKKIIFFLNHL